MAGTDYARFLVHRRRAERAIGRHLVAALRAGQSISGLIGENGLVKGADMSPEALISLCGAAQATRGEALARLRR